VSSTRAQYDLAYALFLFCGLAALLGILMEAIPKDEGTSALLGFFVAIPLAGGALVALLVGITLSIRLPKRWPLVTLAGSSVMFVIGLLIGSRSAGYYYAICIVYGTVVIALSGVWFFVLRRREAAG
jgi:hypothetical protein